WDSVDLEKGTINMQRQLLAYGSELLLEETTKSESGRRTITMTDDAIRELKKHKARQAEEKLFFGKAYQNNNLLFCKEDGTFIDPRYFTKRFQQHLEAAGLPKVRLHDLRHTHASLLLARGVHAKVVQERLGHSSITMTLDLYSHLIPGLDEAAAASLNGLLSKEKSPAKDAGQAK
ncbi:MAG TPA: site-specific integrase, partial [bacterium]|nr:site-specific integrase [bacterium]